MRAPIAAALVVLSVLATAGCVGPFRHLAHGRSCSTIGVVEGFGVDLTTVVPIEGGDYDATVSAPALGASGTTPMAGNDFNPPYAGLEVDLDGDPVTVHVDITDSTGATVYSTSDVVTPAPLQPDWVACAGESYWVGLQARPDGQLLLLPSGESARDTRGRTSVVIDTRCGIWDVLGGDGIFYTRVDGPLDDGAGGPPPGWASPAQRGWATSDGTTLLFEDERGHRELFRVRTESDWSPVCTE